MRVFNEEFVQEKARWRIPEGMIRHQGDAVPENLRILRVRGNSMEPEMREGDRLLVDTGRCRLTTGEMFVLWDNNGLVAKRVEALRSEPRQLKRLSANPDYESYTCLAEDGISSARWSLGSAEDVIVTLDQRGWAGFRTRMGI